MVEVRQKLILDFLSLGMYYIGVVIVVLFSRFDPSGNYPWMELVGKR